MKRATALLATLCLLAGCVHTVSEARLREIEYKTLGNTLGTVEYLGRKQGFDYFEARWSSESGRFRVPVPNSLISDGEFPFGLRRVRWSSFEADDLEALREQLKIPTQPLFSPADGKLFDGVR